MRKYVATILIAAGISFFVSVAATVADWRMNPGMVFHKSGATDWGMVSETFLSWFFPLFMLLVPVVLVLCIVYQKMKNRVV